MKKTIIILFILVCVISFSLDAREYGDVDNNGAVDIIDALLIAQNYVGLNSPALTNPERGDVNCDGTMNIVDSLLIAQYYVGLVREFDCFGEPTPGTTAGVFTWAVIVDLDSEPVTYSEAQAMVDQAGDILMELTGFSYEMVDFMEATNFGTIYNLALTYRDEHAGNLPNGIIIFSYGTNDKARLSGGYSFTLQGPPGFINTFNSPVVGNDRIYISVQHYSHRYGRCGYDSAYADEPVQDTALGGECRNQDGTPCVERFGYSICSTAVDDLFASSRTYFGSSVIIHETMHPFGFEGNYDHYSTEKCAAIMASGISDRPYVPFVFPDVTMFQYYNGMCPYVYDNFVESYEP